MRSVDIEELKDLKKYVDVKQVILSKFQREYQSIHDFDLQFEIMHRDFF